MQKYEDYELRAQEKNYYQLIDYLKRHGYKRVEDLQFTADYQIRGDQIYIIPVGDRQITRLDYFSDELETIVRQKKEQGRLILKDNRLITEDGIVDVEGYVVHPQFGIARYLGRRVKKYDGKFLPFFCLEYAGDDQVFFPQTREAELMPYYGKKTPRLTRLHSLSWSKTKHRIEKDIYEIAKGLISIQAQRELVTRKKYTLAKQWQSMLNKSFTHNLTNDQVKALTDINQDLTKSSEPMDRLLTGDVGYGKTEVAIRGAMSVVFSGKQVLVLVPTTVLAEQHFHVWQNRLKQFPIKIIKLSRINKLSSNDIESINKGTYDIVIGTHKLFAKQLKYKNLGLLIIDEEQRFGIKQKEYFKSLRTKVDVLSLTATPIPRTLYMGLSGLRNMSSIKTAPLERKGIVTKVVPYSKESITEAIEREKRRGGQIYYVHNRVQTLASSAKRVKDIMSDKYVFTQDDSQAGKISYAIAHGQTPAKELTKIMHRFFLGKIDILFTTTIIENGLDNPNANTMIIERAENFGLADLYQLRGRVGRRDQKAYALLLIGSGVKEKVKTISDTAKARLETVADLTKLGAGWTIALKDLELRGAGTILGKRQHGNMESIGLVLYSRLLKRAVEKLKVDSSKFNLSSDIVDLWKS